MAVTSVVLAGVDINNLDDYVAGASMLSALEATNPRKAIMLDMEDRPPYYVGGTLAPRTIPLIVLLRGTSYAARKVQWDALKAVIDTLDRFMITWTQDAVVKELEVFLSTEASTDTWFRRVTGQLTAADPRPATV